MSGPRLIINADDFGWSEGANQAVADLYDAGAITSASLMVGGPAAAQAVDLARERPGLAMGLHLTLVHGWPLLPASQVPALVDRDGRLSRNYALAGIRCTLLPHVRRQMEREAEAQFMRFRESGLPLAHVDSHVHFSLTSVAFQTAVRMAKHYGARRFRIPLDDHALYTRMDPEDAARQRGLARWFERQCAAQRRALENGPFQLTDRCYGLFRSERLDTDYLVRLIEALPPTGLFELHCHPTYETEWGKGEAQALRSDAFRAALAARGIHLEPARPTGVGVTPAFRSQAVPRP